MSIKVRVINPTLMKAGDTCTYSLPLNRSKAPFRQGFSQSNRIRDKLGYQVGSIVAATGDKRCRNRLRHRKALCMQLIQETPLQPGSTLLTINSEILIIQNFTNKAASAIMAQYPGAVRETDNTTRPPATDRVTNNSLTFQGINVKKGGRCGWYQLRVVQNLIFTVNFNLRFLRQ